MVLVLERFRGPSLKMVERLLNGMAEWLWSRTDDFLHVWLRDWHVWHRDWHVWVLGFGGDHGNLIFQLVKI